MPSKREVVTSEAKSTASADSTHERLRDLLRKGQQLCAARDSDYAHALFVQCVTIAPNNVSSAEALLSNLRAKFGGNKGNVPFALRWGVTRTLRKAIAAKNWTEALRLGIEELKYNPWHVATLRCIAQVCEVQHNYEAELVYLKQALDAAPKDVEVNRHCARSLGRMGQFDQAIACWHRVETIRGKDAEAARMISQLAEEKWKYPGGRPPVKQPSQQAVAIETEPSEVDEPRSVVLSPQQQLERAIRDEPNQPYNYLELAALFISAGQIDSAESVLNRAIAACGQDSSLIAQLERVCTLRVDEQRRIDEEITERKRIAESPIRIPWVELGLLAAIVVLGLQFVPSAGAAVWDSIDFRQWSRTTWFGLNLVLVAFLVAVRFQAELRALVRLGKKRQRRRM